MEQPNKPVDLNPGQMLISSMGDYVLLPDGEQLRFHVTKVAKGEGRNYTTLAPEPRLVVTSAVDDNIEGKGQTYVAYINPSGFDPKSTLAKFCKAVYGSLENLPRNDSGQWDPIDLVGRPFQAVLENKKRDDGTTRQQFSAYFKAAKDQVRVTIDGNPSVGLTEDDISDIFPE